MAIKPPLKYSSYVTETVHWWHWIIASWLSTNKVGFRMWIQTRESPKLGFPVNCIYF